MGRVKWGETGGLEGEAKGRSELHTQMSKGVGSPPSPPQLPMVLVLFCYPVLCIIVNEFPGGRNSVCPVQHRILRAGTVPGMHERLQICLLNQWRTMTHKSTEQSGDLVGTWGSLDSGWKVSERICSLTAGARMGDEGWGSAGSPQHLGEQQHLVREAECSLDENEQKDPAVVCAEDLEMSPCCPGCTLPQSQNTWKAEAGGSL